MVVGLLVLAIDTLSNVVNLLHDTHTVLKNSVHFVDDSNASRRSRLRRNQLGR